MADSFDLLPATSEDIPRLSSIHVSACAADNAIRLYFSTGDEFYTRVVSMLEQQIGDPAFTHVKAVDKKTGLIAAWSSWVDTSYQVDLDNESAAHAEQPTLKKGNEFRFLPGLATYAKKETDKAMRAWAKDRRHFQLKALFTEEPFRCRGIANAMVRHGNAIADAAGLPTLVQASPYGYPVYAANGFEVIGSLDIDLREWAPKAKSDDKGYGNYRYRFMLREPGGA